MTIIGKRGTVTSNGIKQNIDKFSPMHDLVLLEIPSIKEMTDGGILIAEGTKHELQMAIEHDVARKVLKVGPECTYLKPGDYIFMTRDMPYHCAFDDENGKKEVLYHLVPERLVTGVIRQDSENLEEELKKDFNQKIKDKMSYPR